MMNIVLSDELKTSIKVDSNIRNSKHSAIVYSKTKVTTGCKCFFGMNTAVNTLLIRNYWISCLLYSHNVVWIATTYFIGSNQTQHRELFQVGSAWVRFFQYDRWPILVVPRTHSTHNDRIEIHPLVCGALIKTKFNQSAV